MKKHIKTLAFLFCISCLSFVSCDTEIEYVDSKKPQSIKIADIAENTISVYTTKTHQVKMTVVPENAETTEPVTFKYESSDAEVFTVSPTGLITAVGVGDAVLNVSTVEYPELKTMAIVKITDEYFNITSIEIEANFKNYSMAVGSTIDLSPYIIVKPDNATNPKVTYTSSDPEVATVTENGVIEAKKLGTATIKITAVDKSPVSAECIITIKEATLTDLDRTGWIVTPSHDLPADATISNAPESLIDGKIATCLSMVKPGKKYETVTVPKDDKVFFVIDMQKELAFDYLKLDHRTSNTNAYLRPYALSIFGSNDNSTFAPILENVAGQPDVASYVIHLPTTAKYRYVKVQYTAYDEKSGSTIQLAELNIGNKSF